MVYWRNFILEYLQRPGVWSFCPQVEYDFYVFVDRFYDRSNMRITESKLKHELRTLLDQMSEDGILKKEVKRIRMTGSNYCIMASIYTLVEPTSYSYMPIQNSYTIMSEA